MNIFGSSYQEVGSLQENLVLNTVGKIKIRIGSSFIDLLNDKGELNISAELLNRIEALEEQIKQLKK